ncbi:hypothetical protein LSH36_658g01055 [Paralvinella palmiformis]|uniref:Tetratricopeptide repeat protein n=1 Tax=Paralvinella palmiformis TaxID=53620 RepID=A0AAD9MUC5_9ANNE|nr:hypothetical protein LSH36_658g01055 [Paralvinella palmiformis]
MERLDRIALNTSFSIHSLAEGSEVISEVEEIQEVHNLQSIGNKALETENFEEALQCYGDALEIDENNIDCLCGRAEVYLYLGRYTLAQVDAEHVLAIIPRHSEALILQGQALGNLGYHREALVVFLKALDLESDSDEKSSQLASHVANMAAEYCSMPERLIQKLPGLS